jgi:glutamate-5-semialdehyde dehydrogenase
MKSITPLIVKTSIAAVSLKNVSEKQLKTALNALAGSLEAGSAALLRANKKDLAKQSADNPRNDR